MTPEERQILSNLFRNLTLSQELPRDPAAEKFISRSLHQKRHAAYFLSQTVLLHEKSLEIANARIAELEAEILKLRAEAQSIDRNIKTGFLNDAGLVFEGKESTMPATFQEQHDARADLRQPLPDQPALPLPSANAEGIALLAEALEEVFGPLPTPLEEIAPEYDEPAIRCYEEEFLFQEPPPRSENHTGWASPSACEETDGSDPV